MDPQKRSTDRRLFERAADRFGSSLARRSKSKGNHSSAAVWRSVFSGVRLRANTSTKRKRTDSCKGIATGDQSTCLRRVLVLTRSQFGFELLTGRVGARSFTVAIKWSFFKMQSSRPAQGAERRSSGKKTDHAGKALRLVRRASTVFPVRPSAANPGDHKSVPGDLND